MRGLRLALMALVLWSAAVRADEPPTGVIVDASLLDLKRCRFPKLYAPDDTMLYPPSSLFSDQEYMQGYVGYMRSVAEARQQTARVGERPWVLQPVRVHEADPTDGSMDLTQEQANRLAALEADHRLLSQDRVLIVIGLAIVSTTPAPDATAVAPESLVRIQFSKPLRDSDRDRLTVYHLTADGESAVPGRVTWSSADSALQFQPAAPFEAGERYEARLPADLQATCLAPLGVAFRLPFTIAMPPPATEAPATDDEES